MGQYLWRWRFRSLLCGNYMCIIWLINWSDYTGWFWMGQYLWRCRPLLCENYMCIRWLINWNDYTGWFRMSWSETQVNQKSFTIKTRFFFRGRLQKFAKNRPLADVMPLISNFRPVLNAVCFLLGDSPVSEFHMATFRNALYLFLLDRQVGMKDDYIWEKLEYLHGKRFGSKPARANVCLSPRKRQLKIRHLTIFRKNIQEVQFSLKSAMNTG